MITLLTEPNKSWHCSIVSHVTISIDHILSNKRCPKLSWLSYQNTELDSLSEDPEMPKLRECAAQKLKLAPKNVDMQMSVSTLKQTLLSKEKMFIYSAYNFN